MAQNLCGHTQDEIIAILETISRICELNYCSECPFGKNDDCGIRDNGCPADWGFTQTKVWQPFL